MKLRTNIDTINFFKLVNKSNVTLYTVSEYSAFCIKYYFNIKRNIKVFFPPLRQASIKEELQSDCENIIKGKNFFLLINADKKNKNIKLFLDQWNRFCEETNYDYYAVVIGKINVKLPNIICFNCVTTNDLTYLYRKAFAFIYPSICEGFGYPPVECMQQGTPVIVSNATSIPEVCENAAIYFNPFYPEDLFKALFKIIHTRDFYAEQAKMQYKKVEHKQEQDLQNFLKDIIS